MKKSLFVTILFLLLTIEAYCYETNVHQTITNRAISSSNIESYLKDNLKINLTDNFNSKTAQKWMEQGSVWEDDNLTMRWLNHFYDPTTGKGLNSGGLVIYGEPSLQWGKLSTNSWDWESARDYYYSALTSKNKTDREKDFADTFRSLGQLIHLVEDLAVPAHTRNDAHPYPPEWVCENCLQQQRDMYEKYTRFNVNDLTYSGYSAVDLTTFNTFDTFWINGGKGLAEYTNSNFLSRNTNIDDNAYSSPVGIGEWVTTEKAYDPDYGWIYVDVKYLQGYATDNYRTGQSSPISRLSAFSYFDYEMNKYLGKPGVYSLNNYVHQDYASQLIPRAVGYSAGLLDYFFRGKMDMIKDPNNPNQYIIKNLSNENMFGAFSLYYDDISDNRHLIITMENLSINANSQSDSVTFTPPADAKEPCKYILVFQGQMGQEQGVVVGKVVGLDCGTLTIDGSETITRNSNSQYTANGCCGAVEWSVSGKGATISSTGLLTAGATACGTLTITATCAACGTSATQYVRVTDAGQWVLESTPYICFDGSTFTCIIINGDTERREGYDVVPTYLNCPIGEPPSPCYFENGQEYTPPPVSYKTFVKIYKWQCL